MLFLIATIVILIAFIFHLSSDAKYWMKEAHKYRDLYYKDAKEIFDNIKKENNQ